MVNHKYNWSLFLMWMIEAIKFKIGLVRIWYDR